MYMHYLSQKDSGFIIRKNRPQPKYLSKLVNNNTTFNMNIASYFLNGLYSPHLSTW